MRNNVSSNKIINKHMDNLEKIKELAEEACGTGEEFYDDGIKKRATQTRKLLMEISKLCKDCRTQLLENQKNMVPKRGGKKSAKKNTRNTKKAKELIDESDEELEDSVEEVVEEGSGEDSVEGSVEGSEEPSEEVEVAKPPPKKSRRANTGKRADGKKPARSGRRR